MGKRKGAKHPSEMKRVMEGGILNATIIRINDENHCFCMEKATRYWLCLSYFIGKNFINNTVFNWQIWENIEFTNHPGKWSWTLCDISIEMFMDLLVELSCCCIFVLSSSENLSDNQLNGWMIAICAIVLFWQLHIWSAHTQKYADQSNRS